MRKTSVYQVLLSPVVSEKSTLLQEQNKYMFNVAIVANKQQVKKAVEEIFKVKVTGVNIANRPGKVKRFRGIIGQRSDRKIAIVTLESNQTIDLAAGI
ncbi:50S ribosomal protein L23 [Rickettsiales endosymbiont of Stachyamoeba lipophora]|uniref:50S ribosomal protein L23 n=1 Tax=Rickettsiales endosymbiont of Stachyamoeba lipophora TaxID=2486578 RepID=UPI000F6478D3|nr:50S ribosomal protein L23 [Rickettsiales endosymbiont of Stachyamoeba lipophora]AZL15866.1 50S ribosomal protein L23 [Rickettsiales endosymbiont of Stachyamoeba lipophora]